MCSTIAWAFLNNKHIFTFVSPSMPSIIIRVHMKSDMQHPPFITQSHPFHYNKKNKMQHECMCEKLYLWDFYIYFFHYA